ncbi:unnamed protein product [Rhizoctonia solani]|uniref:Uncharacterized protein n=1 Tax=Rhizoctonia solani TaxID=456999 RepID=A0A8H3CV27_9AGAM|nr:unnamed protein product [Rhizoctonia solani]
MVDMTSRPNPIRRRTDLRGNVSPTPKQDTPYLQLPKSQDFIPWVFRSILATALFRCWYLILLFTAWAACVTVITDKVRDMSIQPTLLTAFGTILGFVISYRTSSAFERYNEGRRLWSTIILASRTFARTVWFHIPDTPPPPPSTEPICTNCAHCAHSATTQSTEHATLDPKPERASTGSSSHLTPDERARCRTLIEKRTTINLIEAFSIAVKHYLRGEEGIEYEDLYHLVKFLPAYTLPGSIPNQRIILDEEPITGDITQSPVMEKSRRQKSYSSTSTTKTEDLPQVLNTLEEARLEVNEVQKRGHGLLRKGTARKVVKGAGGEFIHLAPVNNPPGWAIYDMWPFSYLVHASAGVTQSGNHIAGTKAAKVRVMQRVVTLNVPLEITFYLSSYISALQQRKVIDVPTANTLLLGLNQLVESLSGLERVLTSPIPFSYGAQLWTSCFLYLVFLPFQLWQSLRYVTIPATAAVSFIFFGFLAAGEEIENPFGYDKNDLDMNHFCQNIIHAELVALTSVPVPKPDDWVFSDDNDYVFESEGDIKAPKDWIEGGENAMREVLKKGLNGKGEGGDQNEG